MSVPFLTNTLKTKPSHKLNGGDISFAVKEDTSKVTSFEQYLKDKFINDEYDRDLNIGQGLFNSTFRFTVNRS